jgi:hypothetical protein
MSKSTNQPIDVIQTIEHYIEEQDGVWPNTIVLPIYKSKSLYLYLKNDGNRVQMHHAKKALPGQPFWDASGDVVQILMLEVLPERKWIEQSKWRVWVMENLKRNEIEEILV